MTDLFIKLLNMSISASWLVLAVLLLRLLLRKSPKWLSPVLWGIVGLRLICPFSIESALSLIPSAETVSPEIMLDATPTIDSGIPAVDSVVNPIITESFAPAELASANPLQIWIPVFSVLWLVGIAAMLLYTAISYLRLRIRVRTAVRLRHNICQSENVASPFVLGMLRPKIYLPFGMSERNMAHVIAHEEAHIARRDHWIKPIGFLLLTVYWFNPVLWVAYILLCRDIELACDERVIAQLGAAERADYSEALLACSIPRKMISACPLAFGEVGVKERVKNVLHYKKPAFWLILLAVVASIAVAVCFLTDPLQPTENDVETQNGYRITKMETDQELTITIPKSALPEAVYTEERYTFPENEIIVYQNATTTVYLSRMYTTRSTSPAKGTTDTPTFMFTFAYHDIENGNVISTIYKPVIKDSVTTAYSFGLGRSSTDAADSTTVYPRAAKYGGSSEGKYISVYIDRDVLVAAKDYLTFTIIGFTDIFYEKGDPNHEDDITVIEGGVMGQEDAEEPEPIVEITADEGKITVQNTDNIPEAVIHYATEHVQAAIDSYPPEEGITGATITEIKSVNTGTAGLASSIDMYALKYTLQKQPEPIQVRDTYLLLLCTWGGAERRYEPIGTITEEEIQTVYGTSEMLANYGNAYTAAAANIGGPYRSQKYRTLAEEYALSQLPSLQAAQNDLKELRGETGTLDLLSARVDMLKYAGDISHADVRSDNTLHYQYYTLYRYQSSYLPNDPAQVVEAGGLLLTEDGWLMDDSPRYLVFDSSIELIGEFRCEFTPEGNSDQFMTDLRNWLDEQER